MAVDNLFIICLNQADSKSTIINEHDLNVSPLKHSIEAPTSMHYVVCADLSYAIAWSTFDICVHMNELCPYE